MLRRSAKPPPSSPEAGRLLWTYRPCVGQSWDHMEVTEWVQGLHPEAH